MWRFGIRSVATALLSVSVAACGGRARDEGSGDPPSADLGSGGTGGVGAGVAGSDVGAGVAGSDASAAEADSDLSNSCPQAPSNRSCPAAEIDIHFTRDSVVPGAEVWVEPLQIPNYPQGLLENLPVVEPSKWDRSPLPAGACVLRIHGLSGACLRPGLLFVGTCASRAAPEASLIVPFGYYEGYSCNQGIAPGCPSAAASDWNNGYWWYLVARGEDTDLVVCAPECGTSFGAGKHGCLSIAASG
jgi:hypothetical protein